MLCATLAWRETYVAQLQLKQRLTSDQGGSSYVQALGEELQHAAKGDSWGTADGDKGTREPHLKLLASVNVRFSNSWPLCIPYKKTLQSGM